MNRHGGMLLLKVLKLSQISPNSKFTTHRAAVSAGVEPIAHRLTSRLTPGHVFIVGITGSVASGKSTLSAALKARLALECRVETIATDGYLFSNATLENARTGRPQGVSGDLRYGGAFRRCCRRRAAVLCPSRDIPTEIYDH